MDEQNDYFIWYDQQANQPQDQIFQIYFGQDNFSHATTLDQLRKKIKDVMQNNNSKKICLIVSSRVLKEVSQSSILEHPNVYNKVIVFTQKGVNQQEKYKNIIFGVNTDDNEIVKLAKEMGDKLDVSKSETMNKNEGGQSEIKKKKTKIVKKKKKKEGVKTQSNSFDPEDKNYKQNLLQVLASQSKPKKEKTSQSAIYQPPIKDYQHTTSHKSTVFSINSGQSQFAKSFYQNPQETGFGNGINEYYEDGDFDSEFSSDFKNGFGIPGNSLSVYNSYGGGYGGYGGYENNEYNNKIYDSHPGYSSNFSHSGMQNYGKKIMQENETMELAMNNHYNKFSILNEMMSEKKNKKNFSSTPSIVKPQHVPHTSNKFQTDEEDGDEEQQKCAEIKDKGPKENSLKILSEIKKNSQSADIKIQALKKKEKEKKQEASKKLKQKHEKLVYYQNLTDQNNKLAIKESPQGQELSPDDYNQIQCVFDPLPKQLQQSEKNKEKAQQYGKKPPSLDDQKSKDNEKENQSFEHRKKIEEILENRKRQLKESIKFDKNKIAQKKKQRKKLFQGQFFKQQMQPIKKDPKTDLIKKISASSQFGFKKVTKKTSEEKAKMQKLSLLLGKSPEQLSYQGYNKIEAIWIDPNNDGQHSIKARIQEKCKNFKIMMQTEMSFQVSQRLINNPQTLYILIYSNAVATSIYQYYCYPFENVAHYIVYCGSQETAEKIDKSFCPVGKIFVTTSLHEYMKTTVEIVEDLQKKIGLF